jgi:hypothetical protein
MEKREAIFQVQVFDGEGFIYSVSECPADCEESIRVLSQDALQELEYATLFGGYTKTVIFYR